MNQRKVAFEIIYKTISDKAYTNLLMREKLKELEPIQRPFVTNLVNGVLKDFSNNKVLLSNVNGNMVVKISTELIPAKVENPETADNILVSFATLFISVVGIGSCFILNKRFN